MFKPFKIAYQLENVKVREAKRFSLLRETVAHLLSESARKIPHAAMIVQLDVTPLVEYAKESASEVADGRNGNNRKKSVPACHTKKFFRIFYQSNSALSI